MNNNKNGSKGFSGLSSMVSDVDTALEEVAEVQTQQVKAEQPDQRGSASAAPSKPEVAATDEASTPAAPTPQEKGNPVAHWLVGGIVIVTILAAFASSQKGPEPTPAGATPAPADTTASYTPPPPPPPPDPVVAPAPVPASPLVPEVAVRPSEVKPPVGTANVLTIYQIRYCVAEKIRMEAGQRAMDRTSANAIESYNAAVRDFNSRCASFQYHGNDVETARAEVEGFRGEIEIEAMARFRSIPEPATIANPGLYSQPVDRSPYGAAASGSSRYNTTSRVPRYTTTDSEDETEEKEE